MVSCLVYYVDKTRNIIIATLGLHITYKLVYFSYISATLTLTPLVSVFGEGRKNSWAITTSERSVSYSSKRNFLNIWASPKNISMYARLSGG